MVVKGGKQNKKETASLGAVGEEKEEGKRRKGRKKMEAKLVA